MQNLKIKAYDKIHNDIKEVVAIHWIEEVALLWIAHGNARVTVVRNLDDLQFLNMIGFDKNNKEIHETDVCKLPDGRVGYIAYLKQSCGYVIVLKDTDLKLGHRYGIELHQLERIGNMLVNPKLIEWKNGFNFFEE